MARYTSRNPPPNIIVVRHGVVRYFVASLIHSLTCAEGKLLSRYQRSVLAPVRRPATLLSFDDETVLLVRLGTWLHKIT